MKSMKEIAMSTFEEIRMRKKYDRKKYHHGISTGISTLDRAGSGLKKGELICIAARPSVGKTALASCIAGNLTLKDNKSVLIYSGEMCAEYYLERIISSYIGIDSIDLRDGNLSISEIDVLKKAIDKISDSKLHIDDTPGIRLGQLFDKCIGIKNEDGLDLLIVDFLQLIMPEKTYYRREEEVNEIILGLKRIAQELDIPVIILSQLSRNLELRADHRPLLADFMEECVPNIADTIWFLYRDAYYERGRTDNSVMEVIVAKQYMGATSYLTLSWEQGYGRCSDYRFLKDESQIWEDIVTDFLKNLQRLTNTDISEIDVKNNLLIDGICEHDMTGVFELGNDDMQFLMKEKNPKSFEELVNLCAIAHGIDIDVSRTYEDYEAAKLEIEMAEKKMKYSVMVAWYKLNHPQEFYQAFFETYVCECN